MAVPRRRSARLAAKRAERAADNVVAFSIAEVLMMVFMLLVACWLQMWYLVKEGTECGSLPRTYFAGVTGSVFAIQMLLLWTASA